MDKTKHNFSKNINRRNVLPIRIIFTCILTALIGIGSIVVLIFQIRDISTQYSSMFSNDYTSVQYINEISNNLYLHQSLMYKYISSTDADKCEELHNEADELKAELNKTLFSFGEAVKNTKYESYYHDIYSNATGYFYDINQVFSFYEAGDINTARYYIEHAMDKCVAQVNDSITELNLIVQSDLDSSQSDIFIRLNFSRILAVISVLIIIIFALYSIINSAKTADEMVSYDSLTEVYNYDKLLRYASKMQKKGRLQEHTIVMLNIKDFKYINQLNGSDAGDEILKNFAAYIYPHIGKQEMISRPGGDSFILFIKSPNTDRIISHILKANISFSVGSVVKEMNIISRCGVYDITFGDDIHTALNNASLALNKAKTSTSNIVYFNDKMVDEMITEKDILTAFRSGIKNEEFKVFYQPKVNITTGKLCGAEALIRWVKDGEIIPPFKFIPVLEKDGSITQLDMYVLDHVCQDIQKWKEQGISTVRISSNFSRLHLQNKKFADNIIRTIESYNILPSDIEVELTESSEYEDLSVMQNFINKMKRHGIYTSIDDFGTGYSSLSMLQELDVDTIKIDKSFIDHINDEDVSDNKTSKMVANVIHLVNDLDRSIVCEGVETKTQARFLVDAGCIIAQGYLYNKPLPKEEFEAKLLSPDYSFKLD